MWNPAIPSFSFTYKKATPRTTMINMKNTETFVVLRKKCPCQEKTKMEKEEE